MGHPLHRTRLSRPGVSLAATLGYVVIADGVLAPVAVILGFIPMLLTAFAYRELNRVAPDCGTTFTWVTKAFGPRSGWLGGWVLTIAGISAGESGAGRGSVHIPAGRR